MNDGRLYSGEGDSPLSNAPNEKTLREDHAGGQTFWLKVSYRGFCTHVDGGGFNTGPDEARRITEFTRPDKTLILVEAIHVVGSGRQDTRDHARVPEPAAHGQSHP